MVAFPTGRSVIPFSLRRDVKTVADPSAPLTVIVAGGGPVGLSFALMLQSHLGERARVRVFDARWADRDGHTRWTSEEDGNRRRSQVVTLQSEVMHELPAELRDIIVSHGSVMWPYGRSSPHHLGPPRNIRIRDFEDQLIQLARDRGLELVPRAFAAGQTDLAGTHVLAVCDGARSATREHFADRFGRGDPSAYSFDGMPYEDIVMALAVKSDLAPADAVLLTVSQNRFLLNTHKGEGVLNVRLTRGEAQELRAVESRTGAPCACMGLQPCTMQRLPGASGALGFVCTAHGSVFRPPLDRGSLLWPRIRDGLRLFGIAEADVSSVTVMRVSMVDRPRFSAEIVPPTPERPATFGFLLGDSANAIHHWPGRGLNSGLLSAISLARCLAGRWSGQALRHADFARHEGNMHMLQYRQKARAWAAVVRPDADGRLYPIADDIRAGFVVRHRRADLETAMLERLQDACGRLHGRLDGLADPDQLLALVARMSDETLSVCVSSGPWDTWPAGGEEVDIAVMLPQQAVAAPACSVSPHRVATQQSVGGHSFASRGTRQIPAQMSTLGSGSDRGTTGHDDHRLAPRVGAL